MAGAVGRRNWSRKMTVRRRTLRRALAIGVIGLAMAAAWGAQLVQASANGALIDRNVNDYVLLAVNDLSFGGGQGADAGQVFGGNVGVNNVDPHLNDNTF